MKRFRPNNKSLKSGFTLIEVVVVLAIAAVVSALTITGFSSLAEGNRRTTCQSNLTQIYLGLRAYAADEAGKYPLYDAKTLGNANDDEGIGLWALYTFPSPADADELPPVSNAPIERYLRSSKVLHCPADYASENVELYNDDSTEYNWNYLSYQGIDTNEGKKPPTDGDDASVYQPNRGYDEDNGNNWHRQLLHFDSNGDYVNVPPASDTIVTWCRFHRLSRDMDNVLFFDGSVQLLPRSIDEDEKLWLRDPKPPQ